MRYFIMNKNIQQKTMLGIMSLTLILLLYNSIQLTQVEGILLPESSSTLTTVNLLAQNKDFIATGVPDRYGKDLGFAYDDIDPYDAAKANAAIAIFSNLDRTLIVEGAELQRYIKILYQDYGGMSCEFCCGAQSIIFENGKPACGCAHSYAMRGLTKYLLLNHPDMNDEEILEEVAKFKVRFFPTIHLSKLQVMEDKGIDVDFIGLTANVNRGIEKGTTTGGGMVGGC
jgi:hypothetical protein